MPFGIVAKNYCGYHDVVSQGLRYVCKPRGVLEIQKQNIYTGDHVEFSVIEEHTGVIEAVEPRKNILEQPAAANVDQAVVVVSLHDPVVTKEMLDSFLCIIFQAGLQPILCVNKTDLIDDADLLEIRQLYAPIIPVVGVSALTAEHMSELTGFLKGKTTVFTGPSGVGKSSLLNKINPQFQRQEGNVSQKNKHGKHTTREVELLFLDETTMVLDTPGFTAIEQHFDKQELPRFFPDIQKYAEQCRFQGCLHRQEPDCAVQAAVAQGRIAKSRFTSYSTFMDAAVEYERNQYKRQYKSTYRKGTNKKWLQH